MIKSFAEYPEYVYTGFTTRFLAFIIDLIMIGSISRMTLFSVEEGLTFTLLSLLIYLLYFIILTKLTNGQTLGKMIFGIRVIGLNEEKLSLKTLIVREGFGRYIQKMVMALYLLTIFTPYKQHFVDMLTDTTVVTDRYLKLYKEDHLEEEDNYYEELIIE